MNIEAEIMKVKRENESKLKKDINYNELDTFYKNAQEKGIVKKAEYNLPPLDTVGKEFYKNLIKVREK